MARGLEDWTFLGHGVAGYPRELRHTEFTASSGCTRPDDLHYPGTVVAQVLDPGIRKVKKHWGSLPTLSIAYQSISLLAIGGK